MNTNGVQAGKPFRTGQPGRTSGGAVSILGYWWFCNFVLDSNDSGIFREIVLDWFSWLSQQSLLQ